MSVRVTKTHVCDRCGNDYDPHGDYRRRTTGDLSFMILRNGSGTRNTNMSLDLCFDCTDLFLEFIEVN